MATLQIKPMCLEDIEDMKLRDWEAKEYRGDYKAQLRKMLSLSDEAFSVRIDGQLGLVFGYLSRSLFSGSCVLWMCATPVAETNWVSFVRLSRTVIQILSAIYPELYTATYPGNARAIRFLKWLGFRQHSTANNTLTMVRG